MNNEECRRKESRFCIAEVYRKYVSCKLKEGASLADVTLLDFSNNGIKIESPVSKEANSVIDCIISLPNLYLKELNAKAKVRYSVPLPDSDKFFLGAEIIETDRQYLTRVFTKIIEFVNIRSGDIF